MNLHPFFVHFPIALLSVYALGELATAVWWRRNETARHIKGALAILGGIALIPAIAFGLYAEELYERSAAGENLRALIELHAGFALFTAAVFGFVALAYTFVFAAGCVRTDAFFSRVGKPYHFAVAFSRRLIEGWGINALALLGLVVLLITGTLGAALGHGADADFATRFVTSIFGF